MVDPDQVRHPRPRVALVVEQVEPVDRRVAGAGQHEGVGQVAALVDESGRSLQN